MKEVKAADGVNDFTCVRVPFSKALHNWKELSPFEVHVGLLCQWAPTQGVMLEFLLPLTCSLGPGWSLPAWQLPWSCWITQGEYKYRCCLEPAAWGKVL